MRQFIACQIAIVYVGDKASIYRRAKVGLLREGSTVYLVICQNIKPKLIKFPIESDKMQVLPASFRITPQHKDIFIRCPSDEQLFSTMRREIKVILRRDQFGQGSKAKLLEKLITRIPPFDGFQGFTKASDWLMQSNLRHLTLTDQNLTSIPKEIITLSATLVSLDLSDNRIEKLSRVFCCKMTNLRLLNLANNRIETLPIEIKFFSRLVDLNIENNRLRMLPSTLSDLGSLERLNLANNNLYQLPAFRRNEIRLKLLDISHNPLDGASSESDTFEVFPSYDETIGFYENKFCPVTARNAKHFSSLFEISMLNIVRNDRLLKLASEASLPRTIVSTMQRDIFKCFKCSRMNVLPAYNSKDILDYVDQVIDLRFSHHWSPRMTFMKLICKDCFVKMIH